MLCLLLQNDDESSGEVGCTLTIHRFTENVFFSFHILLYARVRIIFLMFYCLFTKAANGAVSAMLKPSPINAITSMNDSL